jgi:hypothetical protein
MLHHLGLSPRVEDSEEIRAAAPVINLANIAGISAGVIFGILGVLLVFIGSAVAASSIIFFGAEIRTVSVGIGCIFIGAVTVILTLWRTFRSLDVATRR